MSDNKAFVYQVALSGSSKSEDFSTHQTSPSWVLTIVSWKNRDTSRTLDTDILAVLDPFVIENDCVQVTTDSSKGTLTPNFTALLKITDTNYLTAIAPGDFVFVNMLNWEADANRVANAAAGKNPSQINGFKDGFKGFFKVQGVREVLGTDPQTGEKALFAKVNGFGFTEFNNTIYYNPNLLFPDKDGQTSVFSSNFGDTFNTLIAGKIIDGIGQIITTLISIFVGSGAQSVQSLQAPASQNPQFLMPAVIGKLLDIENVTAAKDVYNYIFGVQQYSGSSMAINPGQGFNPSNLQLDNKFGVGFKNTSTPCQGNGLLKAEYWNQVKAWDILNQYTNAPLNEMYTCFRVDTDGDVMPTIVFRQMPFTTQTLITDSQVTRFMTLPRWYVSPTLITDYDLGRDEAARVNFVQCYAKSAFDKGGVSISTETAAGNYLYDKEDIRRSGLRPYIWNSTMDEIPDQNSTSFRSPTWAKIVGDFLIGGQLKLNGTLSCFGITEPIAVGDNLEFNDVVYHIEQVTHSCTIDQSGKKIFRTTLALSNGVSVSSSGLSTVSSSSAQDADQGNLYAEMKDSNAQKSRVDDYRFNKLLPGVSEAQSIQSRTNVDVSTNGNHSFAQPNTPVSTGSPLPPNPKKNT